MLIRDSQHFCIKENAGLRDEDATLLGNKSVRKTLNYHDVDMLARLFYSLLGDSKTVLNSNSEKC